MNKTEMKIADFKFYYFAFPFLGAFLSYVINVMTGSDKFTSIALFLGAIAGFLAFISVLLLEYYIAISLKKN